MKIICRIMNETDNALKAIKSATDKYKKDSENANQYIDDVAAVKLAEAEKEYKRSVSKVRKDWKSFVDGVCTPRFDALYQEEHTYNSAPPTETELRLLEGVKLIPLDSLIMPGRATSIYRQLSSSIAIDAFRNILKQAGASHILDSEEKPSKIMQCIVNSCTGIINSYNGMADYANAAAAAMYISRMPMSDTDFAVFTICTCYNLTDKDAAYYVQKINGDHEV